MSDFGGTLDLTGTDPDTIGFPAVPSGAYEGTVAKELEWRQTSNLDGSGKLPHDTPYLNVPIQISLNEGPRETPDGKTVRVAGAYVWTTLFVPPADYDEAKALNMKNRFANFLKAIGEDYSRKNYKVPDVEDIIGRDVTVIVKRTFNKQRDEWRNDVQGFKPAGSSAELDEPAGLLR